MAKRIDIEALVTQHGVAGLARKIGVHTRTVERWRNDIVDPSPLAIDKLKGLTADARPDIRRGQQPERQPIELGISDEPRAAGVMPARRGGH